MTLYRSVLSVSRYRATQERKEGVYDKKLFLLAGLSDVLRQKFC
jgi:hypothetical protein